MPSYNGTISLSTGNAYPGDKIAGEVKYTAFRVCCLKGVKLRLRCRAIYYHQGRKRHVLDDRPPIRIQLLHTDGRTTVRDKENLTEVNRDTVFKFQERLPFDLPPSTEGDSRRVLDVSYTLELSSKGGFFGTRKRDSSTALTVLALLGLNAKPFSEMVRNAMWVADSRFGQGLDMLAWVCLPRFGWQRRDRMEVKVHVTRLPGITNHEVTATLERTIRYKHLSTTTDVTRSGPTRMPQVTYNPSASLRHESSWERVRLDPLLVEIPEDTPLSGVMSYSTLSIHYRLRVDIKPTSNDLPTFTVGVPLVIGALQEVSSKGESEEDQVGGTEPVRHRQASESSTGEHGPSSSSSWRTTNSESSGRTHRPRGDPESFTSSFGGHLNSSVPSRHSHASREEPGPPSTTSSGPTSCSASGSHQPHPSRHAASPPTQIPRSSGERFESSTERPEGSFTPAGEEATASVDTQTSFPYFGPQQRQQSTSDGDFYYSADSQSRLNVENLSSRTTRSSSSNVSSPPRSNPSVESSGPPAMGVRVPGGAAHAPSARGQPSSSTYRKEVASTSPHHSATNWEDSLRRYHAPPDPRLVPQRPSSSSHGHHDESSLTEVKQRAGRTISPVPEQVVFEHRNPEGRFSDLDPRHKAAKRRRSNEMC